MDDDDTDIDADAEDECDIGNDDTVDDADAILGNDLERCKCPGASPLSEADDASGEWRV
jgi:hypothetical protein